jgi:hypothetical protein
MVLESTGEGFEVKDISDNHSRDVQLGVVDFIHITCRRDFRWSSTPQCQ